MDKLRDSKFIVEQIKQKLEGKYYAKIGYVIFITKWLYEDNNDDATVMEDGSIKFKVRKN